MVPQGLIVCCIGGLFCHQPSRPSSLFGKCEGRKSLDYYTRGKPAAMLFECTARNLEYVLDECAKRAGLPARILSFEALRWTCAVRDLRGGMDQDTLRRKLGLSHISWVETSEKLRRLLSAPL